MQVVRVPHRPDRPRLPEVQLTMREALGLVAELETAEIIIEGRMPNSSNLTFRVWLGSEDSDVKGIYKPLAGERPLWDFPAGLHKREVAAWRLSEAMGLHVVPPTVLREGPLGEGSLQLFIEHDPSRHYFTILDGDPHLHDQLRAMAVFDFVANNTDRKGGHVLVDDRDDVWGIDHGVCFSEEFKLRTVIWDFGGEEIADHLLDSVRPIAHQVPLQVAALLDEAEVDAMTERAQWLLDHRRFPRPESRYQYPWPLL